MMLSLANTLVSARASGGFVGPLDDYTANLAGAWSVARRLLASYTGALIRVRRSSDDTEQDISADSAGALDSAALLAFCGAGNGFLRWVYDQSGNARNAGASAAVEQLQIVTSGALSAVDGAKPACVPLSSSSNISLAGVDLINLIGVDSGMLCSRTYYVSSIATAARQFNDPTIQVNLWYPFGDGNLYFDYGGFSSGRVLVAKPSGFNDSWTWASAIRHAGTQSIRVNSSELVSASRSATNSTATNTVLLTDGPLRFVEMACWTSGADAVAKEAAFMA
jgi:hypothetical protein